LYNYHLAWAEEYPEIEMHAVCIVNVITNQIRLWETENYVEITDISEKTRNHILNELDKRAKQYCYEFCLTGIRDIDEKDSRYNFIIENYIGNINNPTVELKNQVIALREYYRENSNPKIVRTSIEKIDPYYMLRFKNARLQKN
jgi:hypothetical protein